ncbi:MAG TPA: hypothetical protein VF158_10390 [Longimicrobiales bacterium]
MRIVRVVATLGAPAVIADEFHLDGLLAAAHPDCRAQHLTRETDLATLRDPSLPVMALTEAGVTARLCTSAQYADGTRLTTTRWVKRRDGEDLAQLARPANLALGPGKNRMGRLPLVASPTITWEAVGDRRGITRLLQRLTHVGSDRASGYGYVRAWSVTWVETETPETVLVRDGVAQRHLPVAWCEWAAGETTGALVFPYWHPGRQVERIVPAGTRCVLRPAIVTRVRDAARGETQSRHRARHEERAIARALEAQRTAGAPLSKRVQAMIEKHRRYHATRGGG